MTEPTITFELVPEARPMLDFVVVNHGSVVTFTPLTIEADAWWDENVVDGPRLGTTRAVEPRLAENLLHGIQAEGFTI